MKNNKFAFGLGIVGVILMIGVIVICIPFTVPKLFGLDIFQVLTESMEPSYPQGSVVYIKDVDPENIEVGDAITFTLGSDTDLVMTHRVIAIDEENQTFTTKGDANEVEDATPVSFDRVVGTPVLCLKGMGRISNFIHSVVGMLILGIIFAISFICFLGSDILKKQQKEIPAEDSVTEEGKEAHNKKNRVSSALLMLAGVACIAVALYYLVPIIGSYVIADNEYEDLETSYVDDGEDWKDVTIDFDSLKMINSEVVGWIQFDNIDLSYPILQASDNDKYLHETMEGTASSSGSIFLEAENNPDFQDAHTIVYGHNMKNLSMFGKLKKYKTEDFYEGNEYFTIYTPDAAYRYQIFSYRDVPVTSDVYTVGYSADEVFQTFINEMISSSYYDTGVDVTKDDKVVTLSTCSTTGNRFVVHAVLIDQVDQ